MSGLVSPEWINNVCACAHMQRKVHENVHATWGSKQAIIFQLNEGNFYETRYDYQGCTQKNWE